MTAKRVELTDKRSLEALRRIGSQGVLMAYDIEAFAIDHPETAEDYGGLHMEILGRHEYDAEWETIYSHPVNSIEEARQLLASLKTEDVM